MLLRSGPCDISAVEAHGFRRVVTTPRLRFILRGFVVQTGSMDRGSGGRSLSVFGIAVKVSLRRCATGVAAGMVVVALLGAASLAVAANPSRELAVARAINLRASDVPGFSSAYVVSRGGRAKKICPGLRQFAGPRGAVSARSPVFSSFSGQESVYSRVAIERSRRVAMRDGAVARTGHMRACLKRELEASSFKPGHGLSPVRYTRVRVKPLRLNAAGTDGGFGIRVRMVVYFGSRGEKETSDIIGFAVGRDEIGLFASREGGGSFPRRTERRLSTVLVNRALANPH
jgi:hypothetical protein